VPEMAPTEIHALARIMGELDYYQLLHLKSDASPRDVKLAFHASSRVFHPDANRHLDDELRSAVAEIAKRVTEAYQVLRDTRRRHAYDDLLTSSGATRIRLADAASVGSQKDTENRQGRTPQGRQYFNLAMTDVKKGDFSSAARQLQTAITFEPDNEFFKSELAEIRIRNQ
jgi:DnaJ-class molecular chaperone